MTEILPRSYWLVLMDDDSCCRIDEKNADYVLSALTYPHATVKVDDIYGSPWIICVPHIVTMYKASPAGQAAARQHMRAVAAAVDALDPEGADVDDEDDKSWKP